MTFRDLFESSNYELYHDTYTSAIQTAERYAEKQGFTLDPEEMAQEIGLGPGKPKNGSTTKHHLSVFKNGKLQRKKLHIQVYDRGQDGNRYELNAYIA